MDTTAFRTGFQTGFPKALALIAAVWLAGCSGSGSTNSNVDQPPAQEPPAQEPPAEEPPAQDPSGQPSVNLSVADTVLDAGETTMLSWTSQNTSTCSASGGWSGSKPVQGSVSIGPLSESTTFTLSCSGDGGNAVAMLSVSVIGMVTLEWEAPTENVDGSPLTDLAGYRIYYGELSGNYTDDLPLSDQSLNTYQMSLPSGSYYFAMTALDADGNESAYSNEVVKVVN